MNSGGGAWLNGNVTTTGAQLYSDAITLGGKVTLDTDQTAGGNAGNVTFTSTVNGTSAGTNTLIVDARETTGGLGAGGGVTFGSTVGATTRLAGLAVAGIGVAFTGANNVDTLAIALSGAGNGVSYADADSLDIGTVGGIAGITTNGGAVTLAAGGAITQTAAIAGTGMLTLATGASGQITLTNAGNQIGAIQSAGTWGTGSHQIVDSGGGLTVEHIDSNGDVSITSAGGTLKMIAGVNLGGKALTLTNSSGAITFSSAIYAAGGITLITDSLATPIGNQISTPVATIRPATAGTKIDAGGADAAGVLGLSQSDFSGFLSGPQFLVKILVGDATTGTITFTAGVTITPTTQTEWVTGADIRDTVSGAVYGNRLALDAQTGIGVLGADGALNVGVSFLEARTVTGGISLAFDDAFVVIGNVSNSLGGLTVVTSGDIKLTDSNVNMVGGQITVAENVSVNGSGTILLEHIGPGTSTIVQDTAVISSQSGAVTLTADDLEIGTNSATPLISTTGAVTLAPASGSPGRAISLGSEVAGSLSLTDAELDRVSAGVLKIGSATAGDITLSDAISPANAATLSLETGGAVVDGTAGEQPDITVTSLAITASTGIGRLA